MACLTCELTQQIQADDDEESDGARDMLSLSMSHQEAVQQQRKQPCKQPRWRRSSPNQAISRGLSKANTLDRPGTVTGCALDG